MQARTAEESGDHAAAAEYRSKARYWNIAGIIGGVSAIVISLIIIAVSLGVIIPLYTHTWWTAMIEDIASCSLA